MTTELSRKKRHEQGTIYRISGGIYTSGAECPLSEIPLKDTTSRLLRKYFNAMANLYGIIPLRKADVKNPVLDYEWDTYMNFDYLNLVWRAGGNINTGVGAAATAVEKSNGKLKKKEVDKAAKAVYKSNAKALGNTVTEYAGKIGRRSTYLSIAYCGIDIGMDYLDDKTFGIDSATAIAELAASSAGTYIAASIGIGMALPTGVVVAMTVVVAYVAAYAAKKGVAYINSKLGKAEMQNMCDNMMKSMLDNPDTMNEITAQLAKNNKKVAALVKQEILISETEVGDYITGAKTDRPSPWPITDQEYNSVGLLA